MYCTNCGAHLDSNTANCNKCGYLLQSSNVAVLSPQRDELLSNTRHAGFWMRFVAYIIDAIIIMIAYTPIIFILVFLIPDSAFLEDEVIEGGIEGGIYIFGFVILMNCITWLYFAYMESSPLQATLGKIVMRIVVTDETGKRISFGRATGRYWSKLISGFTLYIGFIMIAFTEKKQGLHDMICGCLVLKK